jgi:hypothetical protein
MGKMVTGGLLICVAFGLSFKADWALVALIIGCVGAALFFWGLVKIFRPRKKV